MKKQKLKDYIVKLQLPQELEKLLFELVDNASEVNQVLLNTIADILDLQADFYEQSADVLDEEADQCETLAAELDALDEEEKAERMEAVFENQKELLSDINQKINEAKGNQEAQSISQIKEQLQQAAQSAPSNPGDSNPSTPPASTTPVQS